MTESQNKVTPPWTVWAENLPESWGAVELRRVAEIAASNVDKNTDDNELPVRLCNYTDVYYNDVISSHLDFMEATATASEIARFTLTGGEVLLTKDSETAADIAIPSFVEDGLESVVCGYHLYLLRPDSHVLDGRFLHRACSVSPIRDQFVIAANGITRYGLGQRELGSCLVPIPPRSRQAVIADFLDRETAKIDALIDQKQRLIELLQEKRAAVVSRAVTRGLNPQADLNESGSTWLGTIPGHWVATKLKFLTQRIVDGVHSTPEYVEDGVPFVTVKNLTAVEYGVSLADTKFISQREHLRLIRRAHPRPGDVLLSKDGTLGVPRVVDTERQFSIFVSVALLRPRRELVDSMFLRFALEAEPVIEQFRSRTLGSALTHLHLGQIANVTIALPPLQEQRRIVEAIQTQLSGISRVRAGITRAIDLLREYRTALISAAVTGKIDVREVAA